MRLVTRATILAAFLLGTGPSHAASYREAYVGTDRGQYIEASSVAPSNQEGTKVAQFLTFSLQFPAIGGQKVDHVVNDREIDCDRRRSRDLTMVAYTIAGEVVVRRDKARAWEAIPTSRDADRIFALVCEASDADNSELFPDLDSARASYLVKSSIQLLGEQER